MIKRNGISDFFDYNVDINRRIVYMGSAGHDIDDSKSEDGVDHAMAEKTIKGLILLDSMAPSGNKPITIIMNNPGGDTYHGLAIYDAIKSCKNKVTILVYGMAMSMGAWILQAADKRILSPNSKVMFHYGYFSVSNHAKVAYKWANENKALDRLMEDHLLERIRQKHPDFTRKKLQKMCDFDTILTAEKSVAIGLADGIIGKNNGKKSKTRLRRKNRSS
jgi:ATP-dependent Clp endopeptidase proteolytic subunit ClpP